MDELNAGAGDSEKPTISVVVTVYNRARYVARALESVLTQTWRSLEIIVVDDCSTDESMDVLLPYAADSRVRIFRNPANLGDYANRNRGASLATGKYLKFHDSDDVMYPHCLEVMATALEGEPQAAFALTSSRSWPGGPAPMLLTPSLAFEREFLGAGLFNGGPSNALFRMDIFRGMNGFQDIGAASDHLFWMHACARYNVMLVFADLFYYRIHAEQERTSPAAAESYARLHGMVWRFLDEGRSPLADDNLAIAKRNWLFILARLTVRDILAGRTRDAITRLREAAVAPTDWLTFLRRPLRSSAAGTPPDTG